MAATAGSEKRILSFTVQDKKGKAVPNFTAVSEDAAKEHAKAAGYRVSTLKVVEE